MGNDITISPTAFITAISVFVDYLEKHGGESYSMSALKELRAQMLVEMGIVNLPPSGKLSDIWFVKPFDIEVIDHDQGEQKGQGTEFKYVKG